MSSPLIRMSVAVLASVAALAVTSGAALAQSNYPEKPIRLIIPFVPGGSNDIIGRTLGQQLATRLKVPVVIENRGGGGGTLGTDAVAKSPADGYTLLFISSSIATNAATSKKLPYDTIRDLEPVARIGLGPMVIMVNNKLPLKNFQDYIDYVKANSGKVNYGSGGTGGLQHLGSELINLSAGIKVTHIPYKGIGPSFTDLMAGQIQMILGTVNAGLPHMRAGTLRALAVTSLTRTSLAPELPTLNESGLRGFSLEVLWGVVGPAGMPKAATTRLYQTITQIMALPDMKEKLEQAGATPVVGPAEELAGLVNAEVTRWTRLIKETNIEVE